MQAAILHIQHSYHTGEIPINLVRGGAVFIWFTQGLGQSTTEQKGGGASKHLPVLPKTLTFLWFAFQLVRDFLYLGLDSL